MNTQSAANQLWTLISKEITGIQLLWEAVEQIYFKQPPAKGVALLESETPLLYRLMQTVFMESILMRMSRLMDPAQTGKFENLSLKKLTATDPSLGSYENLLRQVWDQSDLKHVRDKYLSHNDLANATIQGYTLNIPLSSEHIEAMQSLATGLRSFRLGVHQKLTGVAYVDDSASLQVSREVETLDRSLTAGAWFFGLPPDHPCLQEALAAMVNGKPDIQAKEPPC